MKTSKKRKPVTKKTQKRQPPRQRPIGALTTYARKLSARRLYDLMGALRGPDKEETGDAAGIKTVITGRVRFILFGQRPADVSATWTTTNITNYSLQCISGYAAGLKATEVVSMMEENGGSVRRPAWNPKHYLRHLKSAVEATKGHKIWGGQEQEIIKALGV